MTRIRIATRPALAVSAGLAAVAAVLGVPVSTVKSRTFYALKALRLELTERGVEL